MLFGSGPRPGHVRRRPAAILNSSQAWCKQKPNAPFPPFFVLRNNIFRKENNPCGPTDQFGLLRIGFWLDQRKDSGAVGRGDRYPSITRLKPAIKRQSEPELLDEESYALILISNINVDSVNTEKRVLPIDIR